MSALVTTQSICLCIFHRRLQDCMRRLRTCCRPLLLSTIPHPIVLTFTLPTTHSIRLCIFHGGLQ